MVKRRNRRIFKKLVCLALTGVMLFGEGTAFGAFGGGLGAQEVSAAEEVEAVKVTSMDYYPGGEDGPVIKRIGVGSASFGFAAPVFNGKNYKELDLAAVWEDLRFEEKVGNEWVSIDGKYNPDSPYAWNQDWAWCLGDNWDNYVFWIKLDHSAIVRLRSVSSGVTLEYELDFDGRSIVELSSISCSKSAAQTDNTGGFAFDWKNDFTYNQNSDILHAQIEDDLDIQVDNKDGKGFVTILNNPASGFIWQEQFAYYYNDNGGIYFMNIDKPFTLRFISKSHPAAHADIDITCLVPDRSNTTLSYYKDQKVFNANDSGSEASFGLNLPRINGQAPFKSDLDRFVYQVCEGAVYENGTWSNVSDDKWIGLGDSADWIYQDSGYNKYAAKQQWGYWVDHDYGLWFQPVKDNTYFRIGYLEDNGKVRDDNWLYYTFIGNPDAEFPDPTDMMPIEVDNAGEPKDNTTPAGDPDGWKLIWNDEFNGTSVDENNWANQCGFFINENDADTAGWGNNELEYYTDSPENTSVKDGRLKLTLKKEPKLWYDNNGKPAPYTALYSSGKLISQNKFSVKYGRVDYRAKLPKGNGIWPALWMMPNDDVYGTWAMSGEIDVFEGRGRTPDVAYGTLHYGGVWPGDLESGDKMNMTSTVGSDMTNWHVYSLVWEEDTIKMYVDGICYMMRKNDSWNSTGAPSNPYAPFDQRFYLILNLAAGGYFDGLIAPDESFESTDMLVDYVRVYQRPVEDGEDEKPDDERDGDEKWKTNGANDKLYGDYKLGKVIPATGMTLDKNTLSLVAGQSETLTATVTPSNATNKSITWISSNESVATVKNGVVKALKTGSATITAKLGNFVQTCTVTVTGINVTGISLNKTALSLNVGDAEKLTATVAPANASNQEVSWSSSDETVATVAEDGTVTAVKAGEATITAAAAGGNFTTICKVKVTKDVVPVTSISLNKSEITLKVGTSETLTAQVLPQNADDKSVVWSSSNPRVVTVDSNGKVTALKKNDVVITATTVDGAKQATCKVIVEDSDSSSSERGTTGCEIKDGNIIIYENADNIIFCTFIDSADEVIDTGTIGDVPRAQNGDYWEHVIENGATTYADKYLAYWFNVSPTPVIVKVSEILNADGADLSTNVNYTVKFYQQKISGDGYDLVATEIENGTIGDEVAPVAITYPGFHLNQDAPGSKMSGVIEDENLELAFYYDRDTYKYTYVYNNGSPKKEGTYTYGVGVASLEKPEREGYIFGGWYTEESFNTKVTAITGLRTGDITLYAKWDEEEETVVMYTVTFNSEGEIVASKTVESGNIVTKPAAPTRDGYIFAGWYNGETEYDFSELVTSNLTLTAKWTEDNNKPETPTEYTVTFDSKGGSSVASKKVESGNTVTKPADPTRTGYTFVGWYKGETAYDFSESVTSDLTLTARWEAVTPDTYTVNFDSDGGSTVPSQTIASGNTAAKPADPTKNGYTFVGWYNGAVPYDFNTLVTSDLKLTAKWNQNPTTDPNEVKVSGIKIAGLYGSKKIAAGKKIALKATVAPSNASDKSVTWSTNNKKYATVSKKGVVTTKKAGAGKTVTITATANDGSGTKAIYKIAIMNKAVKKVKLTAMPKIVKAGKKLKIKSAVSLSSKIYKKSKSTKANKALYWKSNNKNYATVDSKGVVTTKTAGKGKTVKITAIAKDGSGKKATIKIKITK